MNAARQSRIVGFPVFILTVISMIHVIAAGETIAIAERVRAGVLVSGVTVDGASRPDIGQSISDSFSAALLKSGDYRVFQIEGDAMTGNPQEGVPLLSGTPNSINSQNVDIAFAFNLVGQDDHYRFTLKKIRSCDKEVLEVHELTTKGGLDRVYDLVPQALVRLQARKRQTPVFPHTQSPAQLSASAVQVSPTIGRAASEVSGNSGYWATRGAAEPDYNDVDLSNVPKALIYQSIGSVQAINETWKFCVIRPKEAMRLRMNDSIHVLYDDNGKVYADMKIASFDSGRVIADFGNKTPLHHKLFPGDEVFGWAPPPLQ